MKETNGSQKVSMGKLVEKNQAIIIAGFAYDLFEILKNNPTHKEFVVSYVVETKQRYEKMKGKDAKNT
jgi:hypothetical protein